MNYFEQLLGSAKPRPQNDFASSTDARMKRLVEEGMTPEEAMESMRKWDAARSAARVEQVNPLPIRKPMATIGVRG